MGFLSGSVSARRSDAISFKTSCSMEPCRPTMESSVTQSAAGQRAPPLIKGPEYSQHDLTALTEGKWQQKKGGAGGGRGCVASRS